MLLEVIIPDLMTSSTLAYHDHAFRPSPQFFFCLTLELLHLPSSENHEVMSLVVLRRRLASGDWIDGILEFSRRSIGATAQSLRSSSFANDRFLT